MSGAYSHAGRSGSTHAGNSSTQGAFGRSSERWRGDGRIAGRNRDAVAGCDASPRGFRLVPRGLFAREAGRGQRVQGQAVRRPRKGPSRLAASMWKLGIAEDETSFFGARPAGAVAFAWRAAADRWGTVYDPIRRARADALECMPATSARDPDRGTPSGAHLAHRGARITWARAARMSQDASSAAFEPAVADELRSSDGPSTTCRRGDGRPDEETVRARRRAGGGVTSGCRTRPLEHDAQRAGLILSGCVISRGLYWLRPAGATTPSGDRSYTGRFGPACNRGGAGDRFLSYFTCLPGGGWRCERRFFSYFLFSERGLDGGARSAGAWGFL